MKTFIYKLNFPNSLKVYVGQSLNPQNRLLRHRQKLRDGIHHSKKLQLEYPDCGIPVLEIIEECDTSVADIQEVYWIKHYNAYTNGYNSTLGGNGTGIGEACPSSKYTLTDYMAVLAFLAHTDMSTKEIAQELGVGVSTVINISSQTNHLYLKDIMPEDWELMVSKKRHHPNWKKYPPVVSPDGKVYTIDNARAFAREHELHQADLQRLLCGKKKSISGGWRVC